MIKKNSRKGLVNAFWDRSRLLNLRNKKYYNFVNEFFIEKLKDDNIKKDITTNALIKNKTVDAKIIAKESGIVSGIEEISLLLRKFKVIDKKKDGTKVKKNEVILEIRGNAKKLLGLERTALNVLQRMSGIATLTDNLDKKAGKCRIATTRKTLWGLLDKKAVSSGKGLTHRLDLSDGILIKDNHLKILDNDLKKALKLINKNKYIEIEVNNSKQAVEVATIINEFKRDKSNKLFAIMFDNMPPLDIKNTMKEINNLNKKNNILFEASGNIDEKNIKKYSNTGVDVISLGFLTHSSKSLDISLKIK